MSLQRMSAMRHVRIAEKDRAHAQALGMDPGALYIYYFTVDTRKDGATRHYFIPIDESQDYTICWHKRHEISQVLSVLHVPQVQGDHSAAHADDLRC